MVEEAGVVVEVKEDEDEDEDEGRLAALGRRHRGRKTASMYSACILQRFRGACD